MPTAFCGGSTSRWSGLTFPTAETISAQLARLEAALMRILMIGGTAFVGRHIAAAALDAGHDVTLFHRGKTGADLFAQATHLTGDRDEDLSALAGRQLGRHHRRLRLLPASGALAGGGARRPGRHVRLHLQRVGLQPVGAAGLRRERAAGGARRTRTRREVTNENYGGLKVACEHVSTELFGPDTTIIRPTYVIGPYDRTYRFTWWVDRIARGGTVLAPGDPDDPIQLIDARDQAALRRLAGRALDRRDVPYREPGAAVRIRPDAGGRSPPRWRRRARS